MNTITRIVLITSAFLIGSCAELDFKPDNADVDEVVFQSVDAYKSYLAKVYAAFSLTGQQGPSGRPDITIVNDEGFTSYIRAYWKIQELTTDEAVIAWTDAGIRDLHSLSWSSENQFVRVVYYRIFYIIAYANDFLGQSTEDKLIERGIPAEQFDEIKRFRAEARFLRALAYWHGLDLFRNLPILTKISTDLPVQSTPEELFAFIESELVAIENDMAEPRANEYGRADKGAVWMLQAKLLLNAESQIGQDRYTDAAAAAKKVIDAGGYSLATNYKELFMADNDRHKDTEFIFTLPSDGVNSQSWGSTTFLVHGALGGRMVDKIKDSDNTTAYSTEDLDLYGVSGGWGGMRTTKVMVDKFMNVAPLNVQDPRGILYTNGQNLEISDVGIFTEGYAVPKFINKTSTGTRGSNVTHADTDYPVFRLADTYLIYAEAVKRGGTGDLDLATTYINNLRERAYGNTTANVAKSDITLDFILDERVRELYWEGTRRIDLIRFGKFANNTWPWKGGVADGNFVTPANRNIFPLPASDLSVNPLLKQNEGY